jgi:hypothetical protein
MQLRTEIFLSRALLVVLCATVSYAQQPAKQPSTQSVNPKEAEARRHYKVALVALQNNDLAMAKDELTKAVELSPRNALIYFNLAVVASKQSDIQAADANLSKAEQLRIPANLKEQAEDLRADIDYKLQALAKEEVAKKAETERIDRMQWVVGSWSGKQSEVKPEERGESVGTEIARGVGLTVHRSGNTLMGSGFHDKIVHILYDGRLHNTRDCSSAFDVENITLRDETTVVLQIRTTKNRDTGISGQPYLDSCLDKGQIGKTFEIPVVRKDGGVIVFLGIELHPDGIGLPPDLP